MKLAFKLIFALVLGVATLLGVEAYVSVAREDEQFEQDLARELDVLGRALGVLVRDAWTEKGRDHALALVERLNQEQHDIAIRWVSLPGDPEGDRPVAAAEQLERAQHGERVTVMVVSEQGVRSLVAYEPLDTGGGYQGALELNHPMTLADQHARETLQRAAVLTLLVAVTGFGLIAVLGVYWVGRPLEKLIAKARRVAAGDMESKVELDTNDELQLLGDELDTMSNTLAHARHELQGEVDARVRAVEQLRHADRLTTVGTLAAGVAHELGTPLNVISGHATMVLEGGLQADDLAESASVIKEQAARMTAIVQRLLAFARRQPPHAEKVALEGALAEAVGLLQPLAQKRGSSVELSEVEEALDVRADPGQLQQVLSNLIMNGLQSRESGVCVALSARVGDTEPPVEVPPSATGFARIDVSDDGAGISGETLEHVLEPFYTTKNIGEGTGLGLSIAHGLVSEHGGWIAIASERGRGSCFSVFLPRAEPS